VSKWRLTSVVVAVFAASVLAASPQTQQPSLNEVLKRAAVYVENFRKQLSGITADETYTQQVVNTARFVDSIRMMPTRRLKSDLLLVKPADADRYVELRDTYEVDGSAIRDRQARLEQLLRDPAGGDRIGAIIKESARYNIGGITRNINTPLMALQFLDAAYQPRMRFRHVDKPTPVFGNKEDASANDAPVFRVSTEMWTIEYREEQPKTLIRTPDGDDRHAHGRFWINPNDGSVLISELIIDAVGGGVTATVTVSYQSEPLMGFLVPVEMRESYIGHGERITGEATYGKFRQISTSPNHQFARFR